MFFGYTHCPDVCPESVGVISQALAASPPGARALFVSIDPERDDVAAMKSYVRYLPTAFSGLTGTPEEVRRAADAWSVRLREDRGGRPRRLRDGAHVRHLPRRRRRPAAGDLSLRHHGSANRGDADVPAHRGPGTVGSRPGALRRSAAAAATPAAATPIATMAPMAGAGDLRATVVSTSVWAGGPSPVILSIADAMGMPLDGSDAG